MWNYEKRLQYPVKITQTNPKLAKIIISQFGGPDGELAASMRYLSQRYTMPYKEVTGILTDIGTEELAHMEMICAIIYQLTKNLSPEEIERSGFAPYYVDHTLALWPQAASGAPWTATYFQSKGDPITDLHEDLAAEQKARTTYDNILRLIKDPEICDPIRFLREREIVHYQRFGEANREDCSKNSRVLKAHKYSIFGNLLSIRKMQDVGISRPICCYTSKLIRKKEIEQAIFIYNLILTRKAAFLTPTQENRNAAFFMPSCYAVRANKALIYAALRARK
nr:manganese catalase family protein [uncultured Mediterraneibacter sp.]